MCIQIPWASIIYVPVGRLHKIGYFQWCLPRRYLKYTLFLRLLYFMLCGVSSQRIKIKHKYFCICLRSLTCICCAIGKAFYESISQEILIFAAFHCLYYLLISRWVRGIRLNSKGTQRLCRGLNIVCKRVSGRALKCCGPGKHKTHKMLSHFAVYKKKCVFCLVAFEAKRLFVLIINAARSPYGNINSTLFHFAVK